MKNTALALIGNGGGDIERWQSPSDIKKRRIQPEKLKEKLTSEQPPRKRVPVARPFICTWKTNDVFVYQLNKECYKNTEYYGKYILLLVDKIVNYDVVVPCLGDMLPITYIKISEKYPQSISDIESAEFIPRYRNGKEYRYLWYRVGFKKFISNFVYWGQCDFYRPENCPPACHSRNENDIYTYTSMFWHQFNGRILEYIHYEKKDRDAAK